MNTDKIYAESIADVLFAKEGETVDEAKGRLTKDK